MFANSIQAGGFVDGLVWAPNAAQVGAALFPAVTFLLAATFDTDSLIGAIVETVPTGDALSVIVTGRDAADATGEAELL